jgi:energy-coupling factor transporter ATP-binding protein EcfA2
MTYDPIRSLEVENYGCIKQQRFELSSLHCFVGPNDSGKSTILRALRTVAQFAAGTFTNVERLWTPFDPMLEGSPAIAQRPRLDPTHIKLRYADAAAYAVRSHGNAVREIAWGRAEAAQGVEEAERGAWNLPGILGKGTDVTAPLTQRLSPATSPVLTRRRLSMPRASSGCRTLTERWRSRS